jgi:ADP-L-glycero-D-manno-heptose 6-epimerase
MNYIVTGAAGFIGSNFIKHINNVDPEATIFISDYLTNGKQFKNLLNLNWYKMIHPNEVSNYVCVADMVFHFGAVSSTTEWNGELLFKRNYEYTINLIKHCIKRKVGIQYSSSASVYGNDGTPLNLYAFFKNLVDLEVDKLLPESKSLVQGFRYFNVYGPNEWHKGDMASPYYKFEEQAKETGVIKIFEGSEVFKRDFVPVDYLCRVQYSMRHAQSGIYDLGTGKQKSFLDVAKEIAEKHNAQIEYIPFPEHLVGHYQSNTVADMEYLSKPLQWFLPTSWFNLS